MAKTVTITLTDNLQEVITSQAERLNKSPEEIVLQVLSQQLTTLFQPNLLQAESDPLLRGRLKSQKPTMDSVLTWMSK